MTRETVSVVGMAGTFPGALDYMEYWKTLNEEKDFYTNNREKGGEDCISAKGMFGEAEYFDAARYGINEKEATLMDPQVRKCIELVDAALLDAGYEFGKGLTNVSVIASQGTNHTYHNEITKAVAKGTITAPDELLENINKGSDFLATRISYVYDFRGPSFNLQSACSSSLCSIVEAFHLLLSGRCDVAICGGVNISYPLDAGYQYKAGSIYSKSGKCRPFDAEADGTIPSNGGGVLVLKRTSDALDAKDRIHCNILGAQSNNDGRNKVSYAAPSSEGQYQLLSDVYRKSEINPRSLSFVECHATGTIVGDPIEVRSLSRLLGEFDTVKRTPVYLSSAKGGIGHLFWAAGVASVIKSILSLKAGTLPANKNLTRINTLLELSNGIEVNDKPVDLGKGCLAGVSCFGVGGTNAHIVIQQPELNLTVAEENFRTLKKSDKYKTMSLLQSSSQTPLAVDDKNEDEISLSEGPNLSLASIVGLYSEALEDDSIDESSEYFDYFGDSVTAVKIISDCKAMFGIEITQDDVFNYQTPRSMYERLLEKSQALTAGDQDATDQSSPLCEFNPYQSRFYLLEKLDSSESKNYNVAMAFDIDSTFPKKKFYESLLTVMENIPLFTHGLKLSEGGVELTKRRDCVVQVDEQIVASEHEAQIEIEKKFGRSFNLESGPVCYLYFVRTDSSDQVREWVSINIHHLYVDGAGLNNLLGAISDFTSKSGTLDPKWLCATARLNVSESDVEFWRSYLAGVRPTQLPGSNKNVSFSKRDRGVIVSGWTDVQSGVARVAAANAVSPFVLVYSLLFDYLSTISDSEKLCVGTTLMNRSVNQYSINCQINNIPVVVDNNTTSLRERIIETKESFINAERCSHVTYDEIASFAGFRGRPLYNILFMFQNQNNGYKIAFDGREYCESSIRYTPLYGDLCLNFTMHSEKSECELTYNKSVYHEADIEAFAHDFKQHALGLLSTFLGDEIC